MNRCFKVIFNKCTGSWVAVSEIFRGFSKNSSAKKTVATTLLATLLTPLCSPSFAVENSLLTDNIVSEQTTVTGVEISNFIKHPLQENWLSPNHASLDGVNKGQIGLLVQNQLTGSGKFTVNLPSFSDSTAGASLTGIIIDGSQNGSVQWTGDMGLEVKAPQAIGTGLMLVDKGVLTGNGKLSVASEGSGASTTVEIKEGGNLTWTGDATLSTSLNSKGEVDSNNEPLYDYSAIGIAVEFPSTMEDDNFSNLIGQDGLIGKAAISGNVDITSSIDILAGSNPDVSFSSVSLYASPFDGEITSASNASEYAKISLGSAGKTISLKSSLKGSLNDESLAAGAYIEGGYLELAGSSINVESSIEGRGEAVGLLADLGGKIKVTADTISIQTNSNPAATVSSSGFKLEGSSRVEGTGAIKIDANSIDSVGVEVRAGSQFSWTGNSTVNVNGKPASAADSKDLEVGAGGFMLVFHSDESTADQQGSSLLLNGNLQLAAVTENVKDSQQAAYAVGLHVATTREDSVLTVQKADSISVAASLVSYKENDYAAALSSYGGTMNLAGTDIKVSAQAQGAGSAYAIRTSFEEISFSNPVPTLGSSVINIGTGGLTNKVTLSAKADSGKAYAIYVAGGHINLVGDVSIESGKIYIANEDTAKVSVVGNLNLSTLDIIESDSKAIDIESSGSITTLSNVVFTNAASETASEIGKTRYENKLNFASGSKLILNDTKYTLDYLKDAKKQLNDTPIVEMTGELVGKLTTADLKDLGGNVLSNATLETNGDATISAADLPADGEIGVGSVNLGDGTSFTVAASGKEMQVVGSADNLISNSEGTPINVKVENDSKLILGGSQETKGGKINGTVTVDNSAGSNTATLTIAGANNASELSVFNVSDSVTASGNSDIIVTDYASLETNQFTVAENATLFVGEALKDGTPYKNGVGHLVVNDKMTLSGNMVLDPAWGAQGSSKAALKSLTMEKDAQIVVGQNSMLVLGDTKMDDAQKALAKLNLDALSEGSVEALLFINLKKDNQIDLSNGSILVSGAATGKAKSDGLVVKANGLLGLGLDNAEVEKASQDGNALFESTKLTMENGSYLVLNMEDVTSTEDLAINLINLSNGSSVGDEVKVDGMGGLWYDYRYDSATGKIFASYDPTEKLLENGLVAPNVVRATLALSTNSTEVAGLTDFRKLLSEGKIAEASAWMNQRALFSTAGAAQAMAVTTSSMVSDTIIRHGSLISSYDHDKVGMDLWIDVDGLFSRANSYEAGTSKYGYRGDLAGITLGSDYSFGNGLAAGAAFSVGKGSVRSKGEASGIKNKIEYFGINLYGTWNTQYANVIGTLGYIQSKNELSSSAAKAKPDTKAFTVGVRVEKDLNLNDSFTLTPHVGFQYSHIKMDNFAASGFKYSSDNANLYQIPVGIALKGNFESSCGAKVKPFIDLSVSPTMGDKKVKNVFALEGSSASDTIDARIANNALFNAKVGLEATRGNHSIGLNYGLNAGNKGRTDQLLQAKYRYSF